MSTQDLSGKIALVTGASRGIGAAIADTLAAAGANVIGTATSESGAAAISGRLAQWGGEGRALNSAEPETIENLIADILKSVFRASKAVLRGMMKQRAGRIINITSVVGVMGNAGQTNYAAAKAGLIGFSKSMAREVGSRGITVNCVAPGFIDTDMTRALPEETRKTFEVQTSLGKFGEAQDIADAVLFLASDQAKYITGQTLHVNGGMLMP